VIPFPFMPISETEWGRFVQKVDTLVDDVHSLKADVDTLKQFRWMMFGAYGLTVFAFSALAMIKH
jgi:hypothetical protein